MSKFKGITGALRQAGIDAGLAKRFHIRGMKGGPCTGGAIYNDSGVTGKRRIKWLGLRSRMTKAELASYEKALVPLLAEQKLKLRQPVEFHYDLWGGRPDGVVVYAEPREPTPDEFLNDLKAQAAKAGYRLVPL